VSIPSSTAVPGWYGKLPSLGDFANRRLPEEFVTAWDNWLQAMLQSSRSSLGESWLDAYLTMPIWRFVFVPGLLGGSGWAGVVMPSVDRVGRQFPLTVAASLPSLAAVARAIFESADWFADLEEAALSVLDPTVGPDDFDQTLATLPFTAPEDEKPDDVQAGIRRLPSVDAFGRTAAAEALQAWALSAGWTSLWWTRGRVDGDPLMLMCAGLPTGAEFNWLVQQPPPSDRQGRGEP
jgi:type VI secretion system protein ImpM